MKEYLKFNPARPQQRQNYMLTNFVSNYDDLGRASTDQMIKNVGQEVDFLEQSENKGFLERIASYFNLSNPREWIFLLFFSVVITIYIQLLDKLCSLAFDKRRNISSTSSEIFNFIFWVGSAILMFLLATSVGYFISPDSDGSGIPEIKTVLSGINIHRYFSFNAFIGKTIGLFGILVGGPSIGKGGPFVHISTLICNRLMKMEYFQKIGKTTSTKNNMLTAASAGALTLALNGPLGAVLFSIETTASIYIVSNIWKSFFCAVICIFMSKILQNQPLLLTEVPGSKPIKFNAEIFLFIILGLISGFLGAMISTLIAKIVYIRRTSKLTFLRNRFKYAVIVAVIVSVTQYFLVPLRRTDLELRTILFHHDDKKFSALLDGSNEPLSLFILFLIKFINSVLCLTVNCPTGVFGPIFSIGALFGRLYGHLLGHIFEMSGEYIYSLVGAACFLSGATHSLAAALIIFETTGQTTYLAPLLLATLIANLTGQSLAMNIFDVLLVIRNLPHLPQIKSQAMYDMSANDISNKVNFYMETNKLNIINSMHILCKLPKKYHFVIPVIDEDGTIRYTVQVKNLFKYVYNEYEKIKLSYNIKNQSNFNEFFLHIKKKFFSNKRSFAQQIMYKFRKLYITLRDKQRLKLNKNFEEESSWRLLTIFKDNAADDTVFLNNELNLEDKVLSADQSALSVDRNFPVLKVQFLFTFLNVSHIFVTDNGQMVGIITKEEFIKKAALLN